MDLYSGVVPLLADLEHIATHAESVRAGRWGGVRGSPGRTDARSPRVPVRVRDARRSAFVARARRRREERSTIVATVKDAVSIAALCEIAEESAVGGDLDELLSQLVALRLTENPEGIDEAEDCRPRAPTDDRRAAATRLTRQAGRDRGGDETPRAGSRPRGAVAVHRGTEGSAGDAGRAPGRGRRALPRASSSLGARIE